MNRFRFHRDGLFLVGLFCYILNRWGLKPVAHSHFLSWHFNDLWLIPCALPLVLWVQHRLGWRGDHLPTTAEIGGHLILWSVLFEWIGPGFLPYVTGDPMDVLCYWVGGVVAWFWWHRHSFLPRVG